MIFCDYGIVLRRRPLRENDRIVTVFTATRGKMEINFKSVRLAKGKLRALSEPVTHGDYRFFLKKGSNFPVCTGGHSQSVFPRLRLSSERLFLALHCCEVINALTPAHQPSPEKYELLLGALHYLDTYTDKSNISPFFRRAFILRALEAAGFGFKDSSVGFDADLWAALHDNDWSSLPDLPAEQNLLSSLDNLTNKFFTEQLQQQLKTLEFVS